MVHAGKPGTLQLFLTPAADLQLRPTQKLQCTPPCRPAAEGAATLDCHRSAQGCTVVDLRNAAWIVISVNQAEQCSTQATHLHVTECPGCNFSQMKADQQQEPVKAHVVNG